MHKLVWHVHHKAGYAFSHHHTKNLFLCVLGVTVVAL